MVKRYEAGIHFIFIIGSWNEDTLSNISPLTILVEKNELKAITYTLLIRYLHRMCAKKRQNDHCKRLCVIKNGYHAN